MLYRKDNCDGNCWLDHTFVSPPYLHIVTASDSRSFGYRAFVKVALWRTPFCIGRIVDGAVEGIRFSDSETNWEWHSWSSSASRIALCQRPHVDGLCVESPRILRRQDDNMSLETKYGEGPTEAFQ